MSWDPVEAKFYPLIDDIAPLGFEEVIEGLTGLRMAAFFPGLGPNIAPDLPAPVSL
jgi:hypothetical protein